MLAANLGCAGARRLDALAVSFSPLRSRVRAAAERVACGEHVDWAGEAKLGYADQPHVIREFRAQIGETPGIRGALGKRAPSLGKDEQLRPEAETSRGCKRGVGGRTRRSGPSDTGAGERGPRKLPKRAHTPLARALLTVAPR
jgi:hypothetical protein